MVTAQSGACDPKRVERVAEQQQGWRIQRETPGYGPRLTRDELRDALTQARRYRDL